MRTSRCLSLVAAASFVLVSGCAGSGGVGDDEPTNHESDALTENANDKIAFDFFLTKGLTGVQAAGIVGNLDQESGMDPTISQFGGGPGRGIAQWSAGGRWDTTHNANVVWYAGTQGESKYSLNLQLEFIWWELTNEGYGFSELKAATTVAAAEEAFQDRYEICGACDASNRIAHANAALAQFGGDAEKPWAAKYVSQSWPLASAAPIQLTQYKMATGSIDLKNTGTKTWPAGVVKLAPIPRDHASNLAATSWLSPTRVSTIAADVAPGGTGHFEWDLDPQAAGDFQPYFGLVAEGQAWFADSGGPGDNVMQVNVHVTAAPPPSMTTSSSAGAGGAGGAGGGEPGAGGAGEGGEGGSSPHGTSTHASSGAGGAGGSDPGAGGAGEGGQGGSAPHGTSTDASSGAGSNHPQPNGSGGAGGDDASPGANDPGGCSTTSTGAPASSGAAIGLLAFAWAAARRRRVERV